MVLIGSNTNLKKWQYKRCLFPCWKAVAVWKLTSSKMPSRHELVTTVNGSCWILPMWSFDLIYSRLKRFLHVWMSVCFPLTALLAVAARDQPSRWSLDLSSLFSFLKLRSKTDHNLNDWLTWSALTDTQLKIWPVFLEGLSEEDILWEIGF